MEHVSKERAKIMKDNWKLDHEHYHMVRREFHEAERRWRHFAKSSDEGHHSKKSGCEFNDA